MAGRLAGLDLTLEVGDDAYHRERDRLQLELLDHQQRLRRAGRSVVIAFEGWDAAGKGGAIKRLVSRLDPRGYRVVPIGPPTPEEAAHHFLWRFWTRFPPHGGIVIFDRSWYGRVLAERVERLVPKARWRLAYDQINAFEKSCVDEGAILIKFWMHISKAEQLRRFRARERDPFKSWKIGPDDWRNRGRWQKYVRAAEEMFLRTDTPHAPWRLVEAQHKSYGRLKVLRETTHALGGALGVKPNGVKAAPPRKSSKRRKKRP